MQEKPGPVPNKALRRHVDSLALSKSGGLAPRLATLTTNPRELENL